MKYCSENVVWRGKYVFFCFINAIREYPYLLKTRKNPKPKIKLSS
jgi:hypothetical protein